MIEKEYRLSYGIKGKLISATAMLMVAVIMVVSSTYAWFTLSTAPEVKSISTAVGANGALEIVLNTGTGNIKSGALAPGEENTAAENSYWGNLINLGYNDVYGSSKIVLQPSLLNVGEDLKINSISPVTIPDYNAGGRVTGTKGAGQYGTYINGSFVASAEKGFRAIGVASGLTDRQKDFRNALAGIATEQGIALIAARDSLSANGNTLAAIAVKKALQPDKPYVQEEVAAIGNMLTVLENSVKSIESAYLYALIASVLSSESTAQDDTEARAIAALIEGYIDDEEHVGVRLEKVLADSNFIETGFSASLLPGYDKYTAALGSLRSAKESYGHIQPKNEYTWDDIDDSLKSLMDISKVKINGKTVVEVQTPEGKNAVASDVIGGKGILVTIPTDGGIYADIADLCEDYTVQIKINTAPFETGINMDVDAKMQAESTNSDKFLTKVRTSFDGKEPGSGDAATSTKPFTEFYGYVIDLGFKTNAAQSKLLLQYEAKDRIYSDNNNELTMGGGSTMTFKSAANDFTHKNVKDLMDNIHVVFFDTLTDKVLAKAKLDAQNGTVGTDGSVTAYIKLVNESGAFINEQSGAVITALNQNDPQYISALVYLDGTNIGNDDVAATAATSLTGFVNIQFASSANLVPMEYGDLHTPGETTAESTN